jgi:hypothetical protein
VNPLVKHRRSALARQGGMCFYCDLPFAPPPVEGSRPSRVVRSLLPTAEHLHARCDGGADVESNIVAAHALCNSRRHARKNPPPPEIFRALVQRRVAKGRWFDISARRVLRELRIELSTAAVGACDEPTAAVGNSLEEREIPSVICCDHGRAKEDSIQDAASHT